jgi:hypothetical protein
MRLGKKSKNHGTLEMLQHAIGEDRVHTLRQKRKVISVAADEISLGSELLCNARSRGKGINMHVDADWAIPCPSRRNAPPAPTATYIHNSFSLSGLERPLGNRVARKLASQGPVEITVCIHDPVVYERIDRTSVPLIFARPHISWYQLMSRSLRKNWNALFKLKCMAVPTDQNVPVKA